MIRSLWARYRYFSQSSKHWISQSSHQCISNARMSFRYRVLRKSKSGISLLKKLQIIEQCHG